jgi:tetratricopeptide (TPR) repeat protein
MRGILKKATRLYGRGKYPEVIRLLEPQVFRFRESSKYYYLLGMSCLRTGDFGGAYSYLRRGIDLNEAKEIEDTKPVLAMAVVHLRRLENDKALLLWLRILDSDKKNQYANRGLRFLKRNPDPTEQQDLFDSGRFKKYLPSDVSIHRFSPVLIVVGILTIVVFGAPFAYRQFEALRTLQRSDFTPIELDNSRRIFDDRGVYRYLLTDTEIKQTFDRAQRYLLRYRDNLARVEVNRLLHSNASDYVKAQAKLLDRSVMEPDFSTMSDNFEYGHITEDPYLYNRCYIRWKGKVSNLEIGEDAIRFDFLVGYHDERVVLGLVPVFLEFATRIVEGNPIELLGQIIVSEEQDNEESEFEIRGIAIHQLSPLQE